MRTLSSFPNFRFHAHAAVRDRRHLAGGNFVSLSIQGLLRQMFASLHYFYDGFLFNMSVDNVE